MTLYIVVINNLTVRKMEGIISSYATLQLSMVDVSGYNGSDPSFEASQDAPALVIAIAVIVGSLITSFCLGVITYMIVKAVKNRGKDMFEAEDERVQSPGE